MDQFTVDIVIPVWNRPIETRNCLVTLIDRSPGARFILYDNGSDRETERLLEEFAEILGDRALLMKNNANQGLVRSVNRGLARGEAQTLVLVRNTSIVGEGWLEPMLELAASRPDVGLVVPHLVPTGSQRKGRKGRVPSPSFEVAYGSFAAMLVKKELFDRVGGFDEEMDGGIWCLKDYSRRALKNGFLTMSAEGGDVLCTDEAPLGSMARREEAERRSAAAYAERWGEERAFCVYLPKEADLAVVRERFDILLKGARMGYSFTLVAHPKLHGALEEEGHVRLHGGIRIEKLPRLFASKEIQKIFERLKTENGSTVAVTGIDGLSIPGIEDPIPFGRLEEEIRCLEAVKYRKI